VQDPSLGVSVDWAAAEIIVASERYYGHDMVMLIAINVFPLLGAGAGVRRVPGSPYEGGPFGERVGGPSVVVQMEVLRQLLIVCDCADDPVYALHRLNRIFIFGEEPLRIVDASA
jgi:hypothetical protein